MWRISVSKYYLYYTVTIKKLQDFVKTLQILIHQRNNFIINFCVHLIKSIKNDPTDPQNEEYEIVAKYTLGLGPTIMNYYLVEHTT